MKTSGDLSVVRYLEEKSERFDEIGAGFFDGVALTGDVKFGAQGDEAVLLTLDDGRHAVHLLHLLSLVAFAMWSQALGLSGGKLGRFGDIGEIPGVRYRVHGPPHVLPRKSGGSSAQTFGKETDHQGI